MPLFERSLREQAVHDVTAALEEELHTRDQSKAESLLAIAEDYGVAVEELISWIHFTAPGKRWDVSEFVRWAQKLSETRRELNELQKRESEQWAKVCTQCFSAIATRHGPRWWCPSCGDL